MRHDKFLLEDWRRRGKILMAIASEDIFTSYEEIELPRVVYLVQQYLAGNYELIDEFLQKRDSGLLEPPYGYSYNNEELEKDE